jgi:hypothetical protein
MMVPHIEKYEEKSGLPIFSRNFPFAAAWRAIQQPAPIASKEKIVVCIRELYELGLEREAVSEIFPARECDQ